MAQETPTVFVVDDDAAVRLGVTRLLKSAGYDTRSFASAEAFLRCWTENPAPGCLLLDMQMPGLDGIQLQRKLNSSVQALPVIFISGHGDIPSTVTAMRAGAIHFFAKPFNDEELLLAIREAIHLDHLQRIERVDRDRLARLFETLTPREREVMARVVRGLLNKQIAFELGASEKTIKIHRGRVMEKMKVQSVADLVWVAQKLGLQPPSPQKET